MMKLKNDGQTFSERKDEKTALARTCVHTVVDIFSLEAANPPVRKSK